MTDEPSIRRHSCLVSYLCTSVSICGSLLFSRHLVTIRGGNITIQDSDNGISLSGALVLNGNTTGSVSLNVDTAESQTVTIGSMAANLGRGSGTVSVAGVNGGTLTVNGPVQIRCRRTEVLRRIWE